MCRYCPSRHPALFLVELLFHSQSSGHRYVLRLYHLGKCKEEFQLFGLFWFKKELKAREHTSIDLVRVCVSVCMRDTGFFAHISLPVAIL